MSTPNYITIEPGTRRYDGPTDNDIAVLDGKGRTIYMWEEGNDFHAITDGESWWTLYGFEEGILNNVREEIVIDHHGAILYRMYQAAFDRVPDVAGLAYWADQIDDHGLSVEEVAARFIGSTEFKDKFGYDVLNEQFTQAMYQNVLGRDPDAGGYAYWTLEMNAGKSREAILVGFADSGENKAQVLEHIQSGEPWLIL
jgi:hypothetical protein